MTELEQLVEHLSAIVKAQGDRLISVYKGEP